MTRRCGGGRKAAGSAITGFSLWLGSCSCQRARDAPPPRASPPAADAAPPVRAAERAGHHSGRRRGHTPVSPDQEAREARRASGILPAARPPCRASAPAPRRRARDAQPRSRCGVGRAPSGAAGERACAPQALTVGRRRSSQGANYRLIDIPVSNCINSEIVKIYCLTQFNSASLNRHLSSAYVRPPRLRALAHARLTPSRPRVPRRTPTWAATRARASWRCWPRSRARRTPTGSRAPPTPCVNTCGSSRRVLWRAPDWLAQRAVHAFACRCCAGAAAGLTLSPSHACASALSPRLGHALP